MLIVQVSIMHGIIIYISINMDMEIGLVQMIIYPVRK